MLFLSLMFGFGCSKRAMKMDRTTKKVVQNDIPKWVMDPPRSKKEICAVGSYVMKGNISMAQQVSASRARDELSRQLEVHTKSMIKDYIQEAIQSNIKQIASHRNYYLLAYTVELFQFEYILHDTKHLACP